MKNNLLFCFLITTFCYPQDEVFLNIIKADAPLEIRQQKIDSLLKIRDSEGLSEALADFYHDLGSKWYQNNWWDTGNNSDIEKAIFYVHKAYDIKREQGSLKKGSLEKTLFNLGYFNFLKGDIYEAKDFYISLINSGQEKRLIQKASVSLGTLYVSVGDFYKALDRYQEYIDRYKSTDSLNESEKQNLAKVYIFKADAYFQMGIQQFADEIRINLNSADSVLKNTDNIDYASSSLISRINQIKGNRLLEMGNYAEAIPYHQKVLNDSVNLFDFDLAIVYNSLAYSQLKLEDFKSATKNLNKAISYNPNYSDPYENLGDLYLAQDEFEKGLFFYQKAIVYTTDKSKEVKYEDLPVLEDLELATEKVYLLNHIVTKANGWLKYYEYDHNKEHLTHALETFALADQLVDIIRSESTEYQSKLFWREKGASLYMKAVEVCHLLDKPEEAYYFMERNKALLLLEDISSEQAKEIAHLPKRFIKREFELKQAILLSENTLHTTESDTTDTIALLKNEIYNHKRAYNEFTDSLTTAFPEYAKLKNKVDVLPYAVFKDNYISDDEVVLQYILNEEQGYGLLNSTDRSLFFQLDTTGQLNNNIIELYTQLTDLVTNREKLAAYNKLSNTVFQELIPTAAYEIIKDKKLTIITDYTLQQIPFEVLVVDKDKGNYLIEETELRYAYSISYLEAKKHVHGNPEKELIGLAPIQFVSLGLPDLRFSGEEVGEVEKIYHGEVRLNGKATKASLLKEINDYKIVHLSTHADVGEGGNPWIAFSDEKMFLNEIYATKNQAEMVVLSACNTSIGELKKGEGAMSLARGFFHSGAKSVVSSLWSTNDKSSKDLMTAFYKGLGDGLTKSAALRRAKLEYIDRYRNTLSPSYWGALIVIGDNSPIKTAGFSESYWVWIFAAIILLVALLFYRIRKSGSKVVLPQ